jgi:hypothetical protein
VRPGKDAVMVDAKKIPRASALRPPHGKIFVNLQPDI